MAGSKSEAPRTVSTYVRGAGQMVSDVPVNNEWYHGLGDAWWDPDGIVGALHEINPVRVAYFCNALGDLPGKRIVELGCGGGLMAEAYARRGADVVGIDRSVPSLHAAWRHAAGNDLVIQYVGSLAEGLPFAGGTFDAVVTADTLEHVDSLERVVSEAARVLKPGGQFVYDTVNRTWKSRLLLEWLPQRVFRIVPPGTHEYRRFVRPAELHALLARHGLTNRETRGLALRRHPLVAAVSYARRRRLGGFVITDDLGMSYLGYAVKDGS